MHAYCMLPEELLLIRGGNVRSGFAWYICMIAYDQCSICKCMYQNMDYQLNDRKDVASISDTGQSGSESC